VAEQSKRDQDLLALAKARFRQAADASEKAARARTQDIKFYNGDQWDQLQIEARKGSNAGSDGTPPIPARPTSVINKVKGRSTKSSNTDQQNEIDFELVAAMTSRTSRNNPTTRKSNCAKDWRGASCAAVKPKMRSIGRSVARRLLAKAISACIRGSCRARAGTKTLRAALLQSVFGNDRPGTRTAGWLRCRVGLHRHGHGLGALQSGVSKNAKQQQNDVLSLNDTDFKALGDDDPGWFSLTGEGKHKTRMCRVVEYFYTRARRSHAIAAL